MNTTHEDCFFGQRHRAQRGDLEPIILHLLCEKPMHGYEIIRTLEERSHGFWRPSPGSVYPILQYLEEQDLLSSQEKQGKKVYVVTDKGQAQCDAAPKMEHPHPFGGKLQAGLGFRDMRDQIREAAYFVKEIAIHGNDNQIKAVKKVLQQAHDQLKTIVDEMNTKQ
jgi:DNA-binding PadR family transcriptional regulator